MSNAKYFPGRDTSHELFVFMITTYLKFLIISEVIEFICALLVILCVFPSVSKHCFSAPDTPKRSAFEHILRSTLALQAFSLPGVLALPSYGYFYVSTIRSIRFESQLQGSRHPWRSALPAYSKLRSSTPGLNCAPLQRPWTPSKETGIKSYNREKIGFSVSENEIQWFSSKKPQP